jgi:hypothetical protein
VRIVNKYWIDVAIGVDIAYSEGMMIIGKENGVRYL